MAGERILVADDSKHMVSFLAEKVLPALGYEPLVATTGDRALEVVNAEDPDLILLDFNLPDMTGMDIVHQLAASGNQTPVILMTAYGSEQVAVEAFRLGVRDYLSKPVELDEVARSIERALHEPRLQRDKRNLAEQLHRTNLELRRQVDQVAALTSIGRAITASLELDQILTMVSDAAIRFCQAEEATIWLLEEQSDALIMVAEKGVDQSAIRLPRMRVDDWLAGETVRTRQPINRKADRSNGIEIKTGYLVQAVMYVPILVQEVCLGVLSVANRLNSRAFSYDAQKSLEALAAYAAIAIKNAQQFQLTDESLKQRLEELAAINEISEAVSTLDLGILFTRALNRIHKAFDVEAASLFLANTSQTVLTFTLSSNYKMASGEKLQVPFGTGMVGNAVKQGISLFTNEPNTHSLFSEKCDALPHLKTRSLLAVPLVLKDRTIGAIVLFNKNGLFGKQDANLLKAMAVPIAVAVDNASLFEQVARERATLQAVLGGSANPIAIINENNRLIMCNPAFQDLFGVTTKQAIGRPLQQVTAVPALERLASLHRIVTEEIAFQEKYFLTQVAPIRDVGSVIEMQDITHFKDLDRAKTEFVAAVSHDLRAPLSALTGFVELMPEVGPLNPKQQEFISKALSSADRMKELIGDLLDLAKIEAGFDTSPEKCDLYALAHQVVDQFQPMANGRVKVSLLKRGNIPAIRGNSSQLRRALSNLVDNAIKYTPKGGQVRVGMQATTTQLYLAVLDTGFGIPKSDLPHIFDPFYRGKQYDEDLEGSGLGLTMVKSIVESHNGKISVRSQQDCGSTFTIVLPLA